MPEDTKLMILAPIVSERKGEHLDLFEDLQAQGFVRFRIRSGGGTSSHNPAKIYEGCLKFCFFHKEALY